MSTDQERNDIVAKVKAQVLSELSVHDKQFQVSDLTAHLGGLSKGGDQAWTISYSTSAAVLRNPGLRGAEAAWTISYSTSSAAIGELAGVKHG